MAASSNPVPRSQTRSVGRIRDHAGIADLVGEKARVEVVPAPAIEKRIFVIRDRQVMLDEDLADLCDVETKRLIEQVRRNADRFPEDFMFRLDKEEAAALRSQIATSNAGRGGRRNVPYGFTEQGVAMLSGVLRSRRALAVNIEIMRAFIELRRAAASYATIEKQRAVQRAPCSCSLPKRAVVHPR